MLTNKMNYIRITPSYYNDVIVHLRQTFFADEPLNKSLQLCQPGQGHMELEEHSMSTMKDGLSIMAITENDQIAGVCLNANYYPNDIEEAKRKLTKSADEKFKTIFTLLYGENEKYDLFKEFKVEKMFEIRILSVDTKFRGQGLAKNLMLKSEELARSEGYSIIKADATGLFSQKTLESFNFTTKSELYYNTYLDANGEIIFKVDPPHEKMKIMYKLLE